MLTVLLESRAARQRHVGSTTASTLVHGAVIAAVVALTLPKPGDAKRTPDVHATNVTYVRTAPRETRAAQPRQPATTTNEAPRHPDIPIIHVPKFTPKGIPPIDLSQPNVTSDQVLIGRGMSPVSGGMGKAGIGIGISGAGDVNDASAVDRPPRIVGRAAEPRYPVPLRSAGIEGHVLAEFVVDTLGRAELGTLRFPQLTNPLFGDAVREALSRYRFLPGEVAGRKVRTRVAVPFEFRLER